MVTGLVFNMARHVLNGKRANKSSSVNNLLCSTVLS